jgi:NADPH-dependent 2,4-dienoyl-CoA reductase/sulfur reductase-like enzyme
MKYRIEVVTSVMVTEITEKGVVGEFVGDRFSLPLCPTVQKAVLQSNSFSKTIKGVAKEGDRQEYSADTVVYAAGMKPRFTEADALRFIAPEFYQLGDCVAARNIQKTTAEAFAIAGNIGRY